MTREELRDYVEEQRNLGVIPYHVYSTLIDGIDTLEQETKTEWIPVSERLPKAYQKVLVTYEEIHWANEPTTYRVKLISFGGVVDFIAWQPLPEPYKAERGEADGK